VDLLAFFIRIFKNQIKSRAGDIPMRNRILLILAAAVLLLTSGCGYNKIQGLDEEVKAAWAEVLNQYQRRFDLIPNLVKTVKGYASHEKETLQAVVEARAKVGSIQVTPEMLSNPESFQQFQAAQSGLGSALQKLMVVVERYPDLKASENFRDLQSQLEGTENRIAVARRRYIEDVKAYNKAVRYFPTNLTAKYILHVEPKETFQPDNKAIQEAPEVAF
jgi:LemA protein